LTIVFLDAEGRWIFDVSALPQNEKVVTSEFRAVLGAGPQVSAFISIFLILKYQKQMDRRNIATASVLELSVTSKPSKFIPESYRKSKSSSVIPRSDVWTSAPFKRIIHDAIDRAAYLELDVDNLPEE